MPTDLLTPLTALHRPGQSVQRIARPVVPVSSPAGLFSQVAKASAPRPLHALDLLFETPAEVQLFVDWYKLHLGACVPFWVPSYQQDLVPVETIAADATQFDIEQIQYTALYYPHPNRQAVIFLREDGTFLKRDIVGATDNGDGTETIEINEALGVEFIQNNANGICSLWYGRLNDDVVRIEWSDAGTASVTLQTIELLEPPLGGSGTGGPVTGSLPDPGD